MNAPKRHLPVADESGVRLIPATFPDGFTRPTLRSDCAPRPEPCPHCYGIVAHYKAAPGEDGPVVTCPLCDGRVMWGVADADYGGEWLAYDAGAPDATGGTGRDVNAENLELNRCRPCVLESCRWHVNQIRSRRREPHELRETCVLDVADGGASLEDVGRLIGVSRGRVRQIEEKAAATIRKREHRQKRDAEGLGRIGETRAQLAAGHDAARPDERQRSDASVRGRLMALVGSEPGIDRVAATMRVAGASGRRYASVAAVVTMMVERSEVRFRHGGLEVTT